VKELTAANADARARGNFISCLLRKGKVTPGQAAVSEAGTTRGKSRGRESGEESTFRKTVLSRKMIDFVAARSVINVTFLDTSFR
jgi:hypothetical protein